MYIIHTYCIIYMPHKILFCEDLVVLKCILGSSAFRLLVRISNVKRFIMSTKSFWPLPEKAGFRHKDQERVKHVQELLVLEVDAASLSHSSPSPTLFKPQAETCQQRKTENSMRSHILWMSMIIINIYKKMINMLHQSSIKKRLEYETDIQDFLFCGVILRLKARHIFKRNWLKTQRNKLEASDNCLSW